jgi:hypothetical protein
LKADPAGAVCGAVRSGPKPRIDRGDRSEEEVVVRVEQWAEIRRLYFVKRLSIREIVRRTGHGRNTIRRALRSAEAASSYRVEFVDALGDFIADRDGAAGEDVGSAAAAMNERP